MLKPALYLTLCLSAMPLAAQEVVVIGDSIMDWNSPEESVPGQLAIALGVPVDNRAVGGAQVNPGLIGKVLGTDIPAQLEGATPDILVMTGGGNDFGEGCGCQLCDEVLDALVAPDGSGDLGSFLKDQTQTIDQVIYLGYYAPPIGGNAYSQCIPWLTEMDRRIATVADQTPGLTFVSAAEVIDPANQDLYDSDWVHPSPAGAALIGALLADTIRALPAR
ncbi:MAG: SGNH/GDSL hydrolase family protein [Pseudomonadota bacterium]